MPQHHIESVDVQGETVRLVQLTDTHLCGKRGGTLLGMDTDHSLQAVIKLVQQERTDIDLLLGTGDLSDGGAGAAYERLQVYFDQLTPVNYWLPGNHDDTAAMENAATSTARLCREIRLSCWQILLLNSQVVGQVGGELGKAELMVLEQALDAAQEAGQHSLVCLHHPPVTIGCQWLDQQMVADADAFFNVLDRYAGVRAVLWGHVHQEIDRFRNGVRLLASPSTCVQFAPGSESFKVDDQPPGYRWLTLHTDGRIETGVSRVRETKFIVDLDSGGYL